MNKENKGMRLVAMIGKKNSEEYEVINFLPDIKIKHTEANNFEVIENPDYIKIPYAERIDDLGESLIRKKMLSIYDGVYFSETPTEITRNNLMDELDNLYKESIGNKDILLKIDELKELIKSEGK